jgi:hypothetical protein
MNKKRKKYNKKQTTYKCGASSMDLCGELISQKSPKRAYSSAKSAVNEKVDNKTRGEKETRQTADTAHSCSFPLFYCLLAIHKHIQAIIFCYLYLSLFIVSVNRKEMKQRKVGTI